LQRVTPPAPAPLGVLFNRTVRSFFSPKPGVFPRFTTIVVNPLCFTFQPTGSFSDGPRSLAGVADVPPVFPIFFRNLLPTRKPKRDPFFWPRYPIPPPRLTPPTLFSHTGVFPLVCGHGFLCGTCSPVSVLPPVYFFDFPFHISGFLFCCLIFPPGAPSRFAETNAFYHSVPAWGTSVIVRKEGQLLVLLRPLPLFFLASFFSPLLVPSPRQMHSPKICGTSWFRGHHPPSPRS